MFELHKRKHSCPFCHFTDEVMALLPDQVITHDKHPTGTVSVIGKPQMRF